MHLTDQAFANSVEIGICVSSWMHSKDTIARFEKMGERVIAIIGAADETAQLPFEQNDFVTIRRFRDTEDTDASDRAMPNDVNALLDAAAKAPPGIILFCCPGALSRSPALATAFLMRRDGITEVDALAQVKRIQPDCRPNKLVLNIAEQRRSTHRPRMG